MLNGRALPAGTYTIRTSSAMLTGSGNTTSPNFSGSASIAATNGTINLGPGSGSLTVGGNPLDPTNGATLDGYTGSVTVAAGGGNNLDNVTLNGNAANVLTVSAAPAAFTTDQNTPITFQANVNTSLADTYNLTAQAPPGWTVTIDSTGMVTATPAPGLQSGTYPIQIVAQSTTNPDLVAQTTVNVTITPTQPGITFSVQSDPLITVPFNGAQVPTAFRATIQNLGPSADTYNLTFANVPTGFTLLNSGTSVTVPAGQTGILGLYLQPNTGQPIPPPGTVLSFTVTATSTTDPTITQSQVVTFTVPAIDALTVTSNPVALSTTPGAAVTDVITITNVGNVVENNIALAATLSSGLTLTGLNTLTLGLGQSVTETITVTPDASTPLNSILQATINATFGPSPSPSTQTLTLPVEVVVPGAPALANAAFTAGQIGNTNLEIQLQDLATALTNLVQTPTSAVYQSQAVAALSSLISQVANDTFLVPFEGSLSAASTAIANATTAAGVQTAVVNLGTALDSLAQTLSDEAAYGFTLTLTNQDAFIQPGAPTLYPIVMQNTGSATATYDFSVSGLPAGVTATLSQSSITLAPGASIPTGTAFVTLSLSESGTTLIPATFTITAIAEQAPEITLTTPGQLDLRPEALLVGAVVTNPPFTNPGGQVDVTAQIESTVNGPRQVSVSYTVTDVNGNVLFTDTAPVTVPLSITSGLTTVDLGTFDTTSFSDGSDTITVTAIDQSSQPLPTATGVGSVTIGSPVTASLSVSTPIVPTGSGTVTNTLQINSSIPLPDPLTVDGQTATTPATTVALYQDAIDNLSLAYVSGPNGIDIVNVSNPVAPVDLGTFGQTNIVQGGLTVGRVDTIGGADYLIVGTTPQNSTGKVAPFKLLIYSLAEPLSPLLVSDTASFPNPLNGVDYNSGFLSDMVVQGNTVLVPTKAYFSFGGISESQFGNVLAIDVSNPSAPQLDGVLFPGASNPDSLTTQFGVAIVNSQIAYIASSTDTSFSTQNGVGRVLIVDYSDPTNPIDLGEVDIPGTYQIVAVAVQGNQALVVGRTGGDGGFETNGYNGTMTLSVLDITDPSNPQLVGTTLVTNAIFPTNASGVAKVSAVGLGNGLFAVSEAEVNGNPELLVVDPSDPSNILVSYTPVTAYVNEMAVSGNTLYATSSTSSQGLTIFNIGQLETIPVAVSVEVPNNTGVTIVAGSFSISGAFNTALPQVVVGSAFDKVTWSGVLTSGAADVTITWQSFLTGLGVGQVLPVTSKAAVAFTSQGTPGTVNLPGTAVTGVSILSISPESQTTQPGGTATYDVQLSNPTNAEINYTLFPVHGNTYFSLSNITVNSVSAFNEAFITVEPGQTVAVTEQITVDDDATPGDYPFTLEARAFGPGFNSSYITDESIPADLMVAGAPLLVTDPVAHGVVVALTPSQATVGQALSDQTPAQTSYVVQLTNTGSADDNYNLQLSGLPNGVVYTFDQNYESNGYIVVPPGASNFRDVTVTINSYAEEGNSPGIYPFTVTATSRIDASESGITNGTLTEAANGVAVELSPSTGAPGSTFEMKVINTGTVADTFNLSLAGPAALVATLGTNTTGLLAPGASQIIPITTSAVNFADPGTLVLLAIATSQDNPAVYYGASGSLAIPTSMGMTAQFSPASQTLTQVGPTSFLLLVNNTGNLQDSYSATISGSTGPVSASLIGLDGQPTQTIPIFILPGLSSGAILLQFDLTGPATGTVTVQVNSLDVPGESSSATATVNFLSPLATTTVVTSDHPTGSTYGQTVTFTAAVSAGTGTPTGRVQFQLDGVDYGMPIALTGGMASIAIPGLSAGQRSVTAFYTSNGSTFGNSDDSANPWEQVVQPALLTIGADNETMIYGGTLPTLTVTFTGLVNGDTPATFTVSPNVPPTLATVPTGSNAGSYPIRASAAVDANYDISYVAGTLTINPAALTITANNQTLTSGEPLPSLSATYTGLVNGDTPATFKVGSNVPPTLATVPANSPPGSYPITVSDAADTNYSIRYAEGSLTINPATPTTVSLSGTIFFDYNCNGILDSGELGLPGRTVFLDLDHSGQLDPGDPSAVTAGDGSFQFTGLTPGSYLVREQIIYDNIALTSSASQVINAEADVSGINFGNVPYNPAFPVYPSADLFAGNAKAGAATSYVSGLYLAVLGRNADPTGLSFWANALEAGMPASEAAYLFVNSVEHRQDEVSFYYQSFLGRAPDPASVTWVNMLLNGSGEAAVVERILTSQEYTAKHADNGTFVNDLYFQLLGRQADSSGLAFWEQALTSEVSRATVVADLLNSQESAELASQSFYAAFLHRAPDKGGDNNWVGQLRSGALTFGQVAAEFFWVAPQEFQSDASPGVS